MHLIKRNTCRACGSAALTPVISLGEQYLQGSFVKPGKEIPPIRQIPTSLVRCDPMRDEKACGLLQMEYTVPPEVLYSAYWYRSGTNNTMRNHLQGITEEATGMIDHKKAAAVLDIGCNDGTLLEFYPADYVKFGIDPCDIAQEIKDPRITIIHDAFPSKELASRIGGRKFDIITSIAMLYDLENPIAFIRELGKILSPDGIWVLEMSYMPAMLGMTAYDIICHEHLEYYSLAVIETILRRAWMKVVRVSRNDINGGSFRCYAVHEDCSTYDRAGFRQEIAAMRRSEFDLELDTDKPYRAFQRRVVAHKKELGSLLRKLKGEGKKIHVYGASTKGNTLLQWCGVDHSIIDYAADRSPEKNGARTLGTDVPIISEEESRAMNPDYYLVLPWHFKKEFLEREHEALERGVGFIFPLPKIEIIRGGIA